MHKSWKFPSACPWRRGSRCSPNSNPVHAPSSSEPPVEHRCCSVSTGPRSEHAAAALLRWTARGEASSALPSPAITPIYKRGGEPAGSSHGKNERGRRARLPRPACHPRLFGTGRAGPPAAQTLGRGAARPSARRHVPCPRGRHARREPGSCSAAARALGNRPVSGVTQTTCGNERAVPGEGQRGDGAFISRCPPRRWLHCKAKNGKLSKALKTRVSAGLTQSLLSAIKKIEGK